MTVRQFKDFTKEFRRMTSLADRIGELLDGANLVNAKGRLEKLVPLVQQLLPKVGRMKAQLDQYSEGYTTVTKENEALKKANEKLTAQAQEEKQRSVESEAALSRLQSDFRRVERKLALIPPEVLKQYGLSGLVKEQQR